MSLTPGMLSHQLLESKALVPQRPPSAGVTNIAEENSGDEHKVPTEKAPARRKMSVFQRLSHAMQPTHSKRQSASARSDASLNPPKFDLDQARRFSVAMPTWQHRSDQDPEDLLNEPSFPIIDLRGKNMFQNFQDFWKTPPPFILTVTQWCQTCTFS